LIELSRRHAVRTLAVSQYPAFRLKGSQRVVSRSMSAPRANWPALNKVLRRTLVRAPLTMPKVESATPLARPPAMGKTWRMTRKVNPAAIHTRTACAI